MKALSCLLEIQHRYGELTPTEKRIADYISQNNESVLTASIGELAESIGTAKSAITRCCKSLGFDGYTALKISLAGDITRNVERDYGNTIDGDETADSVANKIFTANIKTLEDTRRFLNIDMIEKVAEVLATAHIIYIYGIGTSAIFSEDFQHRLFQVGYPAIAATDITVMRDSTMNIRKGDVAFAFCDSGRTIGTVEAIALAKANGAVTACLTGYTDSPIAQICDYPLFTTSDEFKYPIESITSRVARVAVLDTLMVTLSLINHAKSFEKMLITRELINATRYPKGGETKMKNKNNKKGCR